MKNYEQMTLEELIAEKKKCENAIWDLEMSDRMTASMRERHRELYRIKWYIISLIDSKKGE